MTDPVEPERAENSPAELTPEEQALAEEYAAYARSGEHREFDDWNDMDGLESSDGKDW
ncbi:hypothetical protein [Deinococcus koreensis]|nr:hypothetical protein [Deinococcus koreensis]